MGKNIITADHEHQVIYDGEGDDNGTHICAVSENNEVIAAFRLNWHAMSESSDNDKFFLLDKFKEYTKESFSYTSRLVVASQFRKSFVLGRLFSFGYALAREKKILFNYCNSRPGLAFMYERMGYRKYNEFIHPHLGHQYALVLLTEDYDYLAEKKSIFLPIAANEINCPKSSQWFKEKFTNPASAAV